MNDIIECIVESWLASDGINKTDEIIDWIMELNQTIKVDINRTSIENTSWFYTDTGVIQNEDKSFFHIKGIRELDCQGNILDERPIIIQNEIGYLGIICKKINGVIHFLMQAKIEPGNINKIQLSPTIQATKSNFTQKHGGKKPNYLEFFENKHNYTIVVDQIQSEQASRFYKKRNRNIILYVEDEFPILGNFKWMTLGQIKKLMKIDNLVNMDTRTVLSCIPFYKIANSNKKFKFNNKFLQNSIFNDDEFNYNTLFSKMNDQKMFSNNEYEFISLKEMNSWLINPTRIYDTNHSYEVIFCDIEIEGREVRKWSQPLFAAKGKALFVLFVRKVNNKFEFLVKLTKEIGSFDVLEVGPTILKEANEQIEDKVINDLYRKFSNKTENILCDVILSEEGGRFYHEENVNRIILIDDSFEVPNNYFWLDFKTLNLLGQFNNVLNIQLRNLLSLLEG